MAAAEKHVMLPQILSRIKTVAQQSSILQRRAFEQGLVTVRLSLRIRTCITLAAEMPQNGLKTLAETQLHGIVREAGMGAYASRRRTVNTEM